MADRDFDLVLFGATGFTGRLVAEYLDVHAPDGVRIALAGRNPEKLESIRVGLPSKGRAWPLLKVDSGDSDSLKEVAQRARVLCTTVGPYAKYGLPVVAACAKAGTHYTDLSGEVQFMRDSIDRWSAEAQRTGARIVHSCGFDSIPSDVGAWLLHQKLGAMRRVTCVVEALRGGFSGGTFASLIHSLEEASKDRAKLRALADPYALSPDRSKEPELGPQRDQTGFAYDDFVQRWTGPFVMAAINTRVVRRTNALLDYPYGRHFRYREVSAIPKGLKGAAVAASLAGLGVASMGLLFGPTRRLITRLLPKPGEGPSEEARRSGRLRLRFYGEAEDGRRATVLIEGQGDPGYQLTSMMLAQASLALAQDEARLPRRAGVLTPMTGIGEVLIDRLRSGGLTIRVE
ncbi:MAG: saccharopine dehydrogenase NADP-binding domain-containing protein [Myxococcota bacterium]